MNRSCWLVLAFALFAGVIGGNGATPTPPPSSAPPQPAYQPQEVGAASGYIPHATYPYAESYGPISPYEGYLYPSPNRPPTPSSYMAALIPSAQTALVVAIRLFAKVGLFLLGGVALLLVGGVFTTAVCSLTPLCTITFNGYSGLGPLDKDTVRSLITPDKLSAAAALVNDAIGKYNSANKN